jgi:8-oxo-dGTP diphosphatase
MPQNSKQHYCLGFLFAEDYVLLIHKVRPAWQKGKMNGIGGHVEPGESPLAAMVREFHEETGLHNHAHNWQYFFVMEFEDCVVHCYRSEWDHTLPIPDSHLFGEEQVRWVTLPWLEMNFSNEAILPNLLWLVPLARQFKGGGPYVQKS